MASAERRSKNRDDRRQHFETVSFMNEAGIKLGMKAIPLSTAAIIYHKFFEKCSIEEYEPETIGTTALYLAGKVEEEHLKIRDVVNVCYRTLHPDRSPLSSSSLYWNLRDTVAQTELLIIRVLQFRLNFTHPHKYLLHYIKSLSAWLNPDVVEKVPFSRTAWAMLNDCYYGSVCYKYEAAQIAVSVLYFSLQCHGVEVPGSRQAERTWWQALCTDIKLEEIRQIICDIIDVYEVETVVPEKKT